LLPGGHALSRGEPGENRKHRRQVRIRPAERATGAPHMPFLAVGQRHRITLIRRFPRVTRLGHQGLERRFQAITLK